MFGVNDAVNDDNIIHYKGYPPQHCGAFDFEMNHTSSGANGTIIFDLYSSSAEIIGYSIAYGIPCFIALVGKYIKAKLSELFSMQRSISILLTSAVIPLEKLSIRLEYLGINVKLCIFRRSRFSRKD